MRISSLKTKMSIAVSLLMALFLSLLAIISFWHFQRSVKQSISHQQFALVSALAQEVDGKIINAWKELSAVAGTATPDIAHDPAKARRFLEAQAGTRTRFDNGMAIFSPSGKMVAALPKEPELEGRDYGSLDYIRNTVQTGRPQISAPLLSSRKHHHPIIVFTAPLFDGRGRVAGIVAGGIDLLRENFLGKLGNVKIGEGGYLYLYSTDRTLIVHPDRSRILRRDVPPGVNRLFDAAIKGFEGTGETVTSRGLHTVSSFKRLKSANWILAANFPETEAYAPIHAARWYLVVALITLPLISTVLVSFFVHHLTAPLLQFTSHVKEITANNDGLISANRFTARYEIGTLADAFNEMLAEMENHKAKIREQKEFSDNLLLNSAVPTFVLDHRHRVVIWNKACEELSGIKATDMIGSTEAWRGFYTEKSRILADAVLDGTPDELSREADSYKKSPFSPDGLQAEGWRRTANGSRRYLFFDAAPVRNAEGDIIAAIQTVQDITERKRAEEALMQGEERYRRLVEQLPDAVFIHSGGIFSFMNRTAAQLLGAPEPEILYGRPMNDFIRFRDPGSCTDTAVIEDILVRLDGSKVPVEMLCIKYNYQGMESVLAIVRDISDRKRMQDELIRAQKLESLGVLAGGIAHDFNNILTGILGNLSLATARLSPGHIISKYLVDCEKATVRAGNLTQQLLTFARGGDPVKKLIDSATLIRENASFVLRGSNVRCRVELPDDLWNVEADSGQLSQALHNVLVNAAQAMPQGGEVIVRAANETLEAENSHRLCAGHYLRIEVEDHGCGIPAENLARIFDPYFTTRETGSGLGLASVYSITRRHGGAVEVASTVGTGTTITIRIPALPGQQPQSEHVQKMCHSHGNGRILIMDDEDIIRDIASQILELSGYEVEACGDGQEAVELFRSALERATPFDVVILDLTVPGGMGGMDAAGLILESDPTAALIVTSGYSNDPVVANFRRYGFSGVVSKPFDAQGLAGEVERLMRRRAA